MASQTEFRFWCTFSVVICLIKRRAKKVRNLIGSALATIALFIVVNQPHVSCERELWEFTSTLIVATVEYAGKEQIRSVFDCNRAMTA